MERVIGIELIAHAEPSILSGARASTGSSRHGGGAEAATGSEAIKLLRAERVEVPVVELE
jgi:hypothetical protein